VFWPAEALRHISKLCLRKLRFTLVSKNVIFHFQLSKKVSPFFLTQIWSHYANSFITPRLCYCDLFYLSKAGFEGGAQISVGTASDCLPAFSTLQATEGI